MPDPRHQVMAVLTAELFQSLAVAVLLAAGVMQPAFMLVYMVSAGFCRVLDTTSRPALVYDVLHAAGAEHMVSTAMALRQVERARAALP